METTNNRNQKKIKSCSFLSSGCTMKGGFALHPVGVTLICNSTAPNRDIKRGSNGEKHYLSKCRFMQKSLLTHFSVANAIYTTLFWSFYLKKKKNRHRNGFIHGNTVSYVQQLLLLGDFFPSIFPSSASLHFVIIRRADSGTGKQFRALGLILIHLGSVWKGERSTCQTLLV